LLKHTCNLPVVTGGLLVSCDVDELLESV
jgi:hypothetical protein